MADALMSALAMFSLKDPSLLAFEKRRYDENIKNLFRVRSVPSDTQMRTILDSLEPNFIAADVQRCVSTTAAWQGAGGVCLS